MRYESYSCLLHILLSRGIRLAVIFLRGFPTGVMGVDGREVGKAFFFMFLSILAADSDGEREPLRDSS